MAFNWGNAIWGDFLSNSEPLHQGNIVRVVELGEVDTTQVYMGTSLGQEARLLLEKGVLPESNWHGEVQLRVDQSKISQQLKGFVHLSNEWDCPVNMS